MGREGISREFHRGGRGQGAYVFRLSGELVKGVFDGF